ncbi:hypothetical protein CVT26_014836 [Gymnopilus dilepis]|uniref:ABM domain-containing protein n=1 Tax=Gymnopilus dilepis TaxID=231916 RepID=A0A409XWX2_9AGAR|nr:hypothetical protein CVT26_014836 [Gymnopilus dilepis]
MPVIEITSWTPSEAYLADASVLKSTLDFLKGVEGCKEIYSGLAENTPQKKVFLVVGKNNLINARVAMQSLILPVWESYEHHKALIDNPPPPETVTLGPAIQGNFSMYHINFTKDVSVALSATYTEVLSTTLREGKTQEDFDKAARAISEQIDLANPEHAPVTWGQSVEDERKFYFLVGWDNLQKVEEVMTSAALAPSRAELRDTVAFDFDVVQLAKHA